ncbi:MAG TPA: hypothetical protein VGA53_04010 [Candidatus Paceibacterota bacterium]
MARETWFSRLQEIVAKKGWIPFQEVEANGGWSTFYLGPAGVANTASSDRALKNLGIVPEVKINGAIRMFSVVEIHEKDGLGRIHHAYDDGVYECSAGELIRIFETLLFLRKEVERIFPLLKEVAAALGIPE